MGTGGGHVILVEESRYDNASRAYFQRHVLAHELGHYVLHAKKILESENGYLPPQELAKLGFHEMQDDNSPVEQIVDSREEVECFSTMFLAPWKNFIKGTSAYYLHIDFGEQFRETD